MMKVEVIGVEQVVGSLNKLSKEVQDKINTQMKVSGARVLADAQRNAPHAWGVLRRSGRVVAEPGVVRVEFTKYARWVEFGRRPGRMPPITVMADWAYKKGIASAENTRAVGYLIARSIARKGTKAQPFLAPAFERERVKFKEAMKQIIR